MPYTRGGSAEDFVRFMRKVALPEEPNGCWLWQAGTVGRGYGQFKVNNKTYPAHRWIYELICEEVPSDLVVRHKCDVPSCVNPMHLESGTVAQNVHDCISRDRRAKFVGEEHPSSRLTAEQVHEIRRLGALGYTHHWIAQQFGVSRNHIGSIVNRITWKCI